MGFKLGIHKKIKEGNINMDKLIENFISNQLSNHNLNNDKFFSELKDEFNSYVFKVYLYSYIKKTIIFSAIQIKKQRNKINKRESLSLNVIDPNFNEERINLIADDRNDELNEFNIKENNYNYNEISYDERIVNAVNLLTDKQKEIIYRCIILGESDTLAAKKIGVSKQAVNKIKLAALNKLRKELLYTIA
jgi:DNA-directed RNA polymerase specialized sigma24 family protein